MPDNKQPWDIPESNQTSTEKIVTNEEVGITVKTNKIETSAGDGSKKYGSGKPTKSYIRGVIKHGADQ